MDGIVNEIEPPFTRERVDKVISDYWKQPEAIARANELPGTDEVIALLWDISTSLRAIRRRLGGLK